MFIRVLISGAVLLFANASHSQIATVAPSASPSLEQRVADLEASVNNGARGSDSVNAKTASNISGSGPGHNGWMMTASALVLFMTLPGLALFYGGLVRQKNVLSILAQCLGIAGLVTILWWAVGYSLVFSGGTVVHMSSGWSALVLCALLGPRLGFRKEIMAPHSMVLCMVGAGMLWVGWYGFNAGSALGADGIAANAFMTTTLATAVASFTWAALEWLLRGKPSVLGFCSGAVGGLVVITPACGFVDANGAVIIGVLAGAV